MRTAISIAVTVLAVNPTMSLGQDAIPDLAGVWSATEGTSLLWDGTVGKVTDTFERFSIEIEKQTDGVLVGVQKVQPKSEATTGAPSGETLAGPTTSLIGVVGWDGRSVEFADVGDTTTYQCALVEDETMQCTYAEAGDRAVAGRVILKRGM